jgi:hypothetical protein
MLPKLHTFSERWSCEAKLASTMDRLNALVAFYHDFIRDLKQDTMRVSMAQLEHYANRHVHLITLQN